MADPSVRAWPWRSPSSARGSPTTQPRARGSTRARASRAPGLLAAARSWRPGCLGWRGRTGSSSARPTSRPRSGGATATAGPARCLLGGARELDRLHASFARKLAALPGSARSGCRRPAPSRCASPRHRTSARLQARCYDPRRTRPCRPARRRRRAAGNDRTRRLARIRGGLTAAVIAYAISARSPRLSILDLARVIRRGSPAPDGA